MADLDWLSKTGLADSIIDYARNGGAVIGICGGYQMLGEFIYDLHHAELKMDRVPGLGLLPIVTQFLKNKATFQAQAQIHYKNGWMSFLMILLSAAMRFIWAIRGLNRLGWRSLIETADRSKSQMEAFHQIVKSGAVICTAFLQTTHFVMPGWKV